MSVHRKEYAAVAGLLLLSVVPVAAGGVRLAQLLQGAAITPENSRFFDAPWPVTWHILAASIFSVAGALQFIPALRRGERPAHRMLGKVVFVAGVVVALSGMWMTCYYPWPEHDGYALAALRLIVGAGMLYALLPGVTAVLRGDTYTHRVWMMRAYALGMGAGTQVFTLMPFFLVPDMQNAVSRFILMLAGWVINLLVVEWVLSRNALSYTV